MPAFSYQSELLTPSAANTCALRMVLGLHGVSLMVKRDQEILALKSWIFSGADNEFHSIEAELRMIFGAESLLGYAFASKVCALACPSATLVPRRLFHADNLDHYFKLLLREGPERQYGYEKIPAFDCYLVWAAESGLIKLCGQYFQEDKIRHIAVPLLETNQGLSPESGYAVFANLRGQNVQISVFERQNLVFYNAFHFTKPSDLLYFVLLAYKQFNLDPLEIPLSLSGTLLEDSEIFRLLQRYIRPLRFPPLPAGIVLPEQAKSLPEHYWFDLTSF